MTLKTGVKYFIRFDEELKQYIYYRILTKNELRDHLAEANKRLSNEQNAIDQFQEYIDDERVVEPEDEKQQPT